MRTIEPTEFSCFYHLNAICFTSNNNVLLENNSPFILFNVLRHNKDIVINNVYFDNNILVVQATDTSEGCLKSCFAKELCAQQSDDNIIKTIIRAYHIIKWNSSITHCSGCGSTLIKTDNIVEKQCKKCLSAFYPNLAPAIMVLIQRANEILLIRAPHFVLGRYSAITGYIDAGETAEEAVHREVQEESGLKISSVKYFGTQSWPFSNGFMIAFHAVYLSGKIKIDKTELEDGQWFNINNIPIIPPAPSIANALINSIINHNY